MKVAADSSRMSITRIEQQRFLWHAFWEGRLPGRSLTSLGYYVPGGDGARQLEVVGRTNRDGIVIDDPHVCRAMLNDIDAMLAGFDNLPLIRPHVAESPDVGPHLIPFLLGADMVYSDDAHNHFTTWAKPMVRSPEEVYAIPRPDPGAHPFVRALIRAIEAIPPEWQRVFPIQAGGGSPIDAAEAVLGSTVFYESFHTHPGELQHLLRLCTDVVIELTRSQIERCTAWRGYCGAPGVYVNDLVTEFLSADHWAEFVLPCYRRIAEAIGGIVFSVNSPDPRVLAQAVAMKGFLGCAVHSRIPLDSIVELLSGRGTLILNSYAYDDRFTGPTLCNGTYFNPIVAAPYRNCDEILRRLAGKVSTAICVHRPEREAAIRDGTAFRRIGGRSGMPA